MTAPRRVIFIDPLAPRPYGLDPASLQGLGGTEATVARIARALASDHTVEIRQSARTGRDTMAGVSFIPPGDDIPWGATVVVINAWKLALRLRRRNPQARVFVWLHVFPGRHNRGMGAALAGAGIALLCVSDSHAAAMRAFCGPVALSIKTLPNPVEDDLHPLPIPRDADRLLFASAPHKGLDQVLAAFATLRRTHPTLTLDVADPGYLRWPVGALPDGVRLLGTLDRASLIDRMRRALCLFYPQHSFAETFGLVIAEANAVGCPALIQKGLGANDEVAPDAGQGIDTSDPDAIAARITAWRRCAPVVRLPEQFRLSQVLPRWRALIDGPPPIPAPVLAPNPAPVSPAVPARALAP